MRKIASLEIYLYFAIKRKPAKVLFYFCFYFTIELKTTATEKNLIKSGISLSISISEINVFNEN